MKTTKDFPIIAKYYYVLDFKKFLSPKLLPVYFLNRNAAKRAIKENVPRNRRKFHSIFKGQKILDLNLEYDIKQGYWGKYTKYDYSGKVTREEKKNYRTVMRRRLRRMGLLTLVKPKKKVTQQPDYIKLIKNTQKIANNPNSQARCFSIDRKPKYYIYILCKKRKPEQTKYLATLKVIRVNKITGAYKYMKLNVLKNDLLIPFILTEVWHIIKPLPTFAEIVGLCESKGILFTNKIIKHENRRPVS